MAGSRINNYMEKEYEIKISVWEAGKETNAVCRRYFYSPVMDYTKEIESIINSLEKEF